MLLPPIKNSETPLDEKRVEYTPIPITRRKYNMNGMIIASCKTGKKTADYLDKC